jgi:hypothetical protein
MKIALDYDKTFTLDKSFWSKFIDFAVQNGHEIVCVTMRTPEETIEMPCKVIYTSRKAKQEFYKPDVWIDDSPHWIYQDSF